MIGALLLLLFSDRATPAGEARTFRLPARPRTFEATERERTFVLPERPRTFRLPE